MSKQTEIQWGEVVTTLEEWPVRSFDEVVLINPSEKMPKGTTAKKVTMDKIQPFTKKIESYEVAPYSGGTKFRNGDTLLARITPCLENGKTAFVDFLDDDEVAFGSTEYIVIREREEITDKQFLYYLAISPDFRDMAIQGMTGSSGRQRVETDVVRNYQLDLPPLPEQRAIAAVLSSLDAKIDLLHRQNATLEALAETLFRQWFVEQAQEGWEEGVISDIIDFNPTYRLKKGELATYLEMGNVSTSTFNPSGWYKREFNSGTRFKNGDTLLARITPCLENGKTAYVTFLEEDEVAWGSTEYIVMRMKAPFHPFLSYVLARNIDFRDFAISSMSGSSGRQRVQNDMLAGYNIKIPDQETIQKMNEQLEAISDKLIANAPQMRTLSTLRDTLLPKLMSGEVRVAC